MRAGLYSLTEKHRAIRLRQEQVVDVPNSTFDDVCTERVVEVWDVAPLHQVTDHSFQGVPTICMRSATKIGDDWKAVSSHVDLLVAV